MRFLFTTRLTALVAVCAASAGMTGAAHAETVNSAPVFKTGEAYTSTAVITKKAGSYLEFAAKQFQLIGPFDVGSPGMPIEFRSPTPVMFGGYVPHDGIFEGGRTFVLEQAETVWLRGVVRDPNLPSSGPAGMPALDLEHVMVGSFKKKQQPKPERPKPEQPGKGEPENEQPGEGEDEDEAVEETPKLKAPFLNRVWTVRAEVNGFDDGRLDLTVARFEGVPKKFRDQDDSLVEEAGIGLVTKSTRVYRKNDGDWTLVKEGRVSALEDADRVRAKVKVLRPSQWEEDEDEAPVPTFSVKRVYILK